MPVPGPIKWHGGKSYLAKKIIELFPPKGTFLHYVEPYFGGGAVLLQNDPEGLSEVANDLNMYLTNFWRTLQTPAAWEAFKMLIEVTPFSEIEFNIDQFHSTCLNVGNVIPDVEAAKRFFVVCRQSLAGRMKAFTALTKTRVRRGMNGEASAWWSAIEGLADVHERLKRVVILNKDAVEVIKSQDGPQTLFYLDPPYLSETRTAPKVYDWEMDNDDHVNLLVALRRLQGKFLLSGYRSKLYDSEASIWTWKRHDFEIPNQAAGGKEKRIMTECVWTNY